MQAILWAIRWRTSCNDLWHAIETGTLQPEAPLLERLIGATGLDGTDRARIAAEGASLVRQIRADVRPGLMEVFLAEYGLSTDEGIALMCLAEALLRVPDAETMDALIEDKIAPSDWGRHLGQSASSLVNASTWALMLTGKVLDDREPGIVGHLRGAVKRLGEPVIRRAVRQAMKEMGRQFVLGETINAAMERAAKMEAQGYTYSYDMLGEAAKTADDAERYAVAYSKAIAAIAAAAVSDDIRDNPGISVKLSALHPRYEVAQEARVMAELVPVVRELALQAAQARMGFNIDAEEADRLTLSLKVIEAVLSDERPRRLGRVRRRRAGLRPRAPARCSTGSMRSPKSSTARSWCGWSRAPTGTPRSSAPRSWASTDFPVFTRKEATDVSYIANARKLLGMTDRIYPQFATHNAHTVAAVLDMGAGQALRIPAPARHGRACCTISC